MCIRDRVSDGYLTQNRVRNSPDQIEYIQGNYEPIISEEAFKEVERIRKQRYNKTVSYTHLDVYKRQAHGRTD